MAFAQSHLLACHVALDLACSRISSWVGADFPSAVLQPTAATPSCADDCPPRPTHPADQARSEAQCAVSDPGRTRSTLHITKEMMQPCPLPQHAISLVPLPQIAFRSHRPGCGLPNRRAKLPEVWAEAFAKPTFEQVRGSVLFPVSTPTLLASNTSNQKKILKHDLGGRHSPLSPAPPLCWSKSHTSLLPSLSSLLSPLPPSLLPLPSSGANPPYFSRGGEGPQGGNRPRGSLIRCRAQMLRAQGGPDCVGGLPIDWKHNGRPDLLMRPCER